MSIKRKAHLPKSGVKKHKLLSMCLAFVFTFTALLGGLTFTAMAEPTLVTLVFDPTDDAGVLGNEANKDKPQGNLATVAVGTAGPREGYLKYLVEGVEGQIVSAKLELSYTYGIETSAGITSIYLTGTAWDDGTLTYTNRPVAMDDGSEEVLVGDFENPTAVESGTPQLIEVDAASAITGNGTYAFHLVSSGTQRTNFASKENKTVPCAKLVITYDPTAQMDPGSGDEHTPDPTPDPEVQPTPDLGSEVTPTPPVPGDHGDPAKTTTIKVTEDSYVANNSGSVLNYGSGTNLVLQKGGNMFEPYLKFNVSGIDEPIRKVYLRVYVNGIVKGEPATPMSVWSTSNSWQENGITWNNRPEQKEKIAQFNFFAVAGYWIEADVTKYVKENGTYSFCLTSDDHKAKIIMDAKDGNAENCAELEIIYGDGYVPPREPLPADFGVVRRLVQHSSDDVTVNAHSSDGQSNTLTLNGSEDKKEAYIAFDIWKLNTDINEAKLRLYYQGGAPEGKVNIYSTYNGWTEDTLTWGNKPAAMPSKPIGQIQLPADAGWLEFDVKSYITGTGRYSFVVTTDAPGSVLINSNEAADDRPEIYIEYQNGITKNILKDVLPSGRRVVERYSDNKLISMGILDVTKAPYYADNTGITDSTLAIQRAINDGRDARCVVYLPSGTYLVSDTLECISPNYDNGTAVEVAMGRNDFGNVLRGSSDLKNRSVIKLVDNAPDFNDITEPKPVIHLWAIEGVAPNIFEQSNINYSQELNSIDLDLNGTNGNPGAIGVDFLACEHSSMECINVDATGAFAGFSDALGSGGAIHRISATGGMYGMYIGMSQPEATVSYATFTGQTAACIYNNSRGPLVLVGAKLAPAPGANAIQLTGEIDKFPFNAGLSMVDGIIEMPLQEASVPAITANRSMYLNNVYVKNAEVLSEIKDAAGKHTVFNGNAAGWCKINDYAGLAYVSYADQQAYNGETVRPDVVIINGNKQFTSNADVELTGINESSIPSDLQSQHTWDGVFPWYDVPGILNAWDYGVTADGNKENYTDQYPALQRAIDEASAKNLPLFLPKGIYRISKSLELKANTHLVGASRNATAILPITGPDENPNGDFLDSTNPQPLIKTVDDADATTILAFLRLFVSAPHIERAKARGETVPSEIICTSYAVLWQAGRNSIIRGVVYRRGGKGSGGTLSDGPNFIIRGNGGGKFYIMGVAAATHMKPTYTQCLIDGTTEPIKIYHFQPQLGNAQANNEFGCEIRNAGNIDIYGIKYEGSRVILNIHGSRNIRVFGEGGGGAPNVLFKVENCRDILFSSINPQLGKTTLGTGRHIILQDRVGTTDINQVLLYKSGNPSSEPIIGVKFSDIKMADWFYDSVNMLVSKGIMAGYQDGSFAPNAAIQVDQFAKMVVKALGYNDIKPSDTDVADGYVAKAMELDLILSGEFDTFTRSITRGEMVRIVVRALSDEQFESDLSQYEKAIKDFSSIREDLKEAVIKGYSKGIVAGYQDGEFKDNLNATRAEAATIIIRMLEPSMR